MIRLVKKTVPFWIKNSVKILLKRDNKSILRRQIRSVCEVQNSLVHQLSKKKIRVAFFLIHDSVWKLDGIYKLMESDKLFEPIIVICPYTVYEESMMTQLESSLNAFSQKGYNVINTLKDDGTWIDVKEDIKPDIVFFTNPHNLTRKEYLIENYLDCLTCYVPYGIMSANLQQSQFNKKFHNYLWKAFYETDVHLQMARKYATNKGRNVLVTGYPGCDIFLDESYQPNSPWKVSSRIVKRIIWAPHHTIEYDLSQLAYSNFLKYSSFILGLLDKFKGAIQIAFKPHPILKAKLYDHTDWGKAKTDDYYQAWDNHQYGFLHEGRYEDLFLTSDAMIFDSISFMTEYLYLNKPSIFMVKDISVSGKFNEFGKLVFSSLNKSLDREDLMAFIDKLVRDEPDVEQEDRNRFLETNLILPDKGSASENIVRHIKSYVI